MHAGFSRHKGHFLVPVFGVSILLKVRQEPSAKFKKRFIGGNVQSSLLRSVLAPCNDDISFR